MIDRSFLDESELQVFLGVMALQTDLELSELDSQQFLKQAINFLGEVEGKAAGGDMRQTAGLMYVFVLTSSLDCSALICLPS